nr:CocE/NonD family hydrolase [Pacificimonas pallii]
MRDGVRLAINLYYPNGREPSVPSPVILVQTRYGRADAGPHYRPFTELGFVVAVVDTRGSTSSFGKRRVDIGPAEIEDMDELIAHLATQSWSSGEVVAQGTSYLADTADIATSRHAPALKGAIIREVDFDVYRNLFFPGGVVNEWFLTNWGMATKAMDEGRAPDPSIPLDCRERVSDCAMLWPMLDPVDGDEEYTLLRQALAGRDRWGPEDYAEAEFIDDAGKNGYVLFDASPSAQLDGIRREAKPAQVWGSWMDGGTAEAALARYRSAPEVPMEIWLTGNDHLNLVGTDPFRPEAKTPSPSIEEQFGAMVSFYQNVLTGMPVERRIHYYVLGANEYRETPIWPPAGIEDTPFYLGAQNTLIATPANTGVDHYDVDFSHTTGQQTRWSAQFGVPAGYGDRAAEDAKLIVFDTAPMAEDMELAGTPVIDLHMAAQSDDPAIFVYLEDVAPDGRVTYITEGVLRAVNRKPADPASQPYDLGPAGHSFKRADALPVMPGKPMRVQFSLNPVAAKIKEGHRVRIAIAGGDAGFFRRYSNNGPDRFTIFRGGQKASSITIPLRKWKG